MKRVSARALARSAVHITAAQLWEMASRLVLTPVVIASLGLDGYGTWVLLFSLCSYATVLNTGIVWAYVKLTAELDQRGEYRRLSEAISSGAVAVTTISAVGLASLWAARTWVLPALGAPATLLAQMSPALALLSLAVLIDAAAGGALCVLAGLQRMDLQYRLIMVGSVVEFAISLGLLLAGYGLVALSLGVLCGQLVRAGFAWGLCCRLRPALIFSPFRAGRDGMRQLMPLGLRFQGVVVLNTAARETLRLLISSLFGTAALGTFQLADRLLYVARSPAIAIISPLMPAFAHLGSDGQTMTERQRLFSEASRAIAIAAALPLGFAAVFADAILLAWTGVPYAEAAWTVRVLAPAEFVILLTGVAAAALRGAGTVGLELRYGLLSTALALAGFAAGYPFARYAGAVVGVACGRAAGALRFLSRLPESWKIDAWVYFRSVLLAPMAAVVPVILSAHAAASTLGLLDTTTTDRWTALLTLALLAIVSAFGSAAVAWFLVMSAEERAVLRRRLPTSP